MSDEAVILLTGGLAAAACALPGTFLVLRGMSLLGDAISHAVLPGIVIAFLLTDSVSSLPVVVGAGAVGLLTVFLIESLHRTRRVKEDASIAVVFPALFAIGVLLVAQYAGQKDLDQDCVLYGEITLAPLDVIAFGGFEISRPMLTVGLVALANAAFVVLLYKELKLATFDGALAATLGFSPVAVHYLLMGSVSVTTVASFESVGAILVVAFLIVPAASAYLLTDRLWVMLLLAAGIGVLCSTIGYVIAREIGDASIAGCMAATMGGMFALIWLFAPREGILGRLMRRAGTRARLEQALVLEHLERTPSPPDAIARDLEWPQPRVDAVLSVLSANGLIRREGAALHPTRAGAAYVRAVVG